MNFFYLKNILVVRIIKQLTCCYIPLQDNHINVVHIESRKSRNNDSEAEIYVELETDNIRLQELIKRLKKQVAGISYNDIPVPPSPATAARVPATGRSRSTEQAHCIIGHVMSHVYGF